MTDRWFKLVLVLAGFCLQLPTQALSAAPDGDGIDVALLLYEEQEAGTDVYPIRVLVNDRHIRIDDNLDEGDFVLLDRETRRLYSISREEQNILVVNYRPVEAKLPAGLELSEVETTDPEAPRIQGRPTVNRQLLANGEICLQVVVVPGLMDAAVNGLAEYARVLGMRQLNSMDVVPESMQTPCFLSRHAYAPARHLGQGLPVQEWDGAGYRRALVGFNESVRVSPALFRLPAGYAEFSLD
jgi:hypothetical protein